MIFQFNQLWRAHSTSPHSGRQNLAQGEASAASETLGAVPKIDPARFSGRQRFALVVLFGVLCAGCNRGNGGGISSGTGGWPPSSSPTEVSSSAQVVKVTTLPVQIAPGGSTDAILKLSIMPGYHINANPATFTYLIATEVTPGKAEAITTDKPIYPAAEKQKFQFEEQPLAVYEGEIQIRLPLRADAKAAAGARSLPITVRVQACDNEKCYPPATIKAEIPVEVK